MRPADSFVTTQVTLRTWNDPYIDAVEKWWAALLPVVKPRLYSAGGGVAMIQLENEFGDYADCSQNENDAKYMSHLYDVAAAALGTDVVYTTVSPARNLMKGSPWHNDSRVLATVDGSLADSYDADFAAQKAFNAPGNSPKMWTELWTGWFTHWLDEQAANKTAKEYGDGVGAMAATPNASFSLYMAHGGTSFGYFSGANILDGAYVADITSYDYNAPIGEAGDHTTGADGGDTFAAIRDAIAAVYGAPPAEPPAVAKTAYGSIHLEEKAALFDQVDALATCSVRADAAAWPTQEALGQAHGFTLFTVQRENLPEALHFAPETLHDRVQAFVDGAAVGVAFRVAIRVLCLARNFSTLAGAAVGGSRAGRVPRDLFAELLPAAATRRAPRPAAREHGPRELWQRRALRPEGPPGRAAGRGGGRRPVPPARRRPRAARVRRRRRRRRRGAALSPRVFGD